MSFADEARDEGLPESPTMVIFALIQQVEHVYNPLFLTFPPHYRWSYERKQPHVYYRGKPQD